MSIINKRKSGILLHITSLPSEFGIGDLGASAYKFANFLNKSKQSYWEILPINPVSIFKGASPYSTYSAFAGNTLLISPQLLYEDGLLKKSDIQKLKNTFKNSINEDFVDYKKVEKEKNKIFQIAFNNFKLITQVNLNNSASQININSINDTNINPNPNSNTNTNTNINDNNDTGANANNGTNSNTNTKSNNDIGANGNSNVNNNIGANTNIDADINADNNIGANINANIADPNTNSNTNINNSNSINNNANHAVKDKIGEKIKEEFENFCRENDYEWLNNFALFSAVKKKSNYISWSKWQNNLIKDKDVNNVNNNQNNSLKDNLNSNLNNNLNKKLNNKLNNNLNNKSNENFDNLNIFDIKSNDDFNLDEEILKEKFLQFIFFKQWFNLKKYCNNLGIKIIGDIPIYVDYESSDVWSNQEIFKLDKNKKPLFVSGVPPDYFSKDGQLWGSPVYDWDKLKQDNFRWWIKRIKYNLKLFDLVRIDHFRGFVAYWEVPAGEKTAKNGKWVYAYAKDFFNTLKQEILSKKSDKPEKSEKPDKKLTSSIKTATSNIQNQELKELIKNGIPEGMLNKNNLNDNLNEDDLNLPIIAENLGYITADVEEIIKENNFLGLRVMLFGFGKDFPNSIHLPHNYDKNCIAYTGTHDNNTIKGWLLKDAKSYEKKNLFKYIGLNLELNKHKNENNNNNYLTNLTNTINSVIDFFIRLIMASSAILTIFPMQDILKLGSEARMNHPSTVRGNWKWKMTKKDFNFTNFKKLKELTEIYSRD